LSGAAVLITALTGLIGALYKEGVFISKVPLELQRRVVNDVVKHRAYTAIVILCAAYAGAVLLQGATMASTKQRLLAEAR